MVEMHVKWQQKMTIKLLRPGSARYQWLKASQVVGYHCFCFALLCLTSLAQMPSSFAAMSGGLPQNKTSGYKLQLCAEVDIPYSVQRRVSRGSSLVQQICRLYTATRTSTQDQRWASCRAQVLAQGSEGHPGHEHSAHGSASNCSRSLWHQCMLPAEPLHWHPQIRAARRNATGHGPSGHATACSFSS